MKHRQAFQESITCPVCHVKHHKFEMFPGISIRPSLISSIHKVAPTWNVNDSICSSCLRKARLDMIEEMLINEQGIIGEAERDVLDAITNQELISTRPVLDNNLSFGDKLSDTIAEIGGSWKFIILFFIILLAWIILNSFILLNKSFDPYPYILLNLILSCVAALQAPVIMMSQNRKEDKDRLRSESDYKINLKAELEIRHLHIKLDQLTTHQWHHLIEIQQMQLDLLDNVVKNTN